MNEYLYEFFELQNTNSFKGQQWFGERQRLVEEYSWAVPNDTVISYLSEFEYLYDIGSGTGYWASLIEDEGGDVVAIDNEHPGKTYTVVRDASVEVYYDRIEGAPVLLVWPPCDDNVAYNVVKQSPSHICYVGEPRGGCTGTSEFFDILEEDYGLVTEIDIPSYDGVNDDFYHYVRKV